MCANKLGANPEEVCVGLSVCLFLSAALKIPAVGQMAVCCNNRTFSTAVQVRHKQLTMTQEAFLSLLVFALYNDKVAETRFQPRVRYFPSNSTSWSLLLVLYHSNFN